MCTRNVTLPITLLHGCDQEDLHVEKPDEELDWDRLDEKMIKRLKCALCAFQIKPFFFNINYYNEVSNSISIKYREDEYEHAGWDLECDESGYVKATQIEIIDKHWGSQDNQYKASRQFKPSQVKEIFIALEHYYSTLMASKANNNTKKLDPKKIGNNERIEDEENADSSNDSEDNNSEHEDKDEQVRNMTIVLKGRKHKYGQLSKEQFAKLMKILAPVMTSLSETIDLSYN